MTEKEEQLRKIGESMSLKTVAAHLDFICRHLGTNCQKFPAIKVEGRSEGGMSTSLCKIAEGIMMQCRIADMSYQYLFQLPRTAFPRPVPGYKLLCVNGRPDCMKCLIGGADIQCMAYPIDKNNTYGFLKITKVYG